MMITVSFPRIGTGANKHVGPAAFARCAGKRQIRKTMIKRLWIATSGT
jgi:hypothetical protein